VFAGASARENHFDWALYYRFKDLRERFWRQRIVGDQDVQTLARDHFSAFQQSIDFTLHTLADTPSPDVLDVGLSSEQLDRAILTRTSGHVLVLDIEAEAERSYKQAFGGRGAFTLGDLISFAGDDRNANRFDLVYSIGLIEHFPDKTDIVGAHVRPAKPGSLVLIYVPVDTPVNRRLTSMAAEWENFGYRELMTPEELRDACRHPDLEVVRVASVGFFAALWARKRQ
jgi:2-polyprenyl-3-methyl-5-hydroxy-6-metoxy-1,4-benzoquinol methylase